jgi:hypothetical protein
MRFRGGALRRLSKLAAQAQSTMRKHVSQAGSGARSRYDYLLKLVALNR